ncbi:MAG: ABC transporter permease [Anaerolineae bacterium]|nr:ABC transporter permease [Anaerolineae bacterium]
MAVAQGVRPTGQGAWVPQATSRRSRFIDGWRRFSRHKLAVLGLFIVGAWIVCGLFAPWIAPYSYRENNLAVSQQLPSAEHWLGTDRLGRDQLSRLIWAARTALIVAPFAVTVSFALGLIFGSLAGYLGGWVEGIIMRVADVLLAFPGLLFALLLSVTLKPRLVSMMEASSVLKDLVRSGYAELIIVILALSVVGWPGLARLVRAQVLSSKNSLYIEAARASGVNTWRVIRQHILPNILAPIIVVLSMSLGGAVVAESGLSFLGLGVEPPIPSWGNMIYENASNGLWRTANAPYLVWAPGAIVSLLVFAFSFIGDGLNEALNPQIGEGSR